MIPISLIVTLEFVKLFQSFFINRDADMYNEENQRYAHVSSTTIIEELGKVEYVFTDKTGTLTCNKMEFKLCMIGNKLYGDRSVLRFQGQYSESPQIRRPNAEDGTAGVDYNFNDQSLNADLRGEADVKINAEFHGNKAEPITSQKALVNEFMTCIALCHDCVVDKSNNSEICYQVIKIRTTKRLMIKFYFRDHHRMRLLLLTGLVEINTCLKERNLELES